MLPVRETFPKISPHHSPNTLKFLTLLYFFPKYLSPPRMICLFIHLYYPAPLLEIIYSCNKQSTYYVPGTVLSSRNMAVSKSDQNPQMLHCSEQGHMKYVNRHAKYLIWHKCQGENKAEKGKRKCRGWGVCRMCSMKLLAVSSLLVSLRGLLVVGQWLRAWALEPDCLGPGSSTCEPISVVQLAWSVWVYFPYL